MAAPTVFFDGTCTLCNGAVHFIIDHERQPELKFAPLQSDPAREMIEPIAGAEKVRLLVEGATGSGDPDSVVLVEDGKLYTHSTAGLRIARRLRWPWSWAVVFFVVPRFIRDAVYRFIARHRYRWFGKEETCRVPTPELKARFLA
jgi:predicted DCC family thiol-disulfide oxidoreductase YuxK